MNARPATLERRDPLFAAVAPTRRPSAWRWLGPLLALAAIGGGYAGWRVLAARIDPRALQLREEASALVLRDDRASLEKAVAGLAEAVRIDPKLYAAGADRALATALLASDARRDANALDAGVAQLQADLSRLDVEKPDGWEAARAALADRVKAARADADAAAQRARALAEGAADLLAPLAKPHGDDVAVVRAFAVYRAVDGNVEDTGKIVRSARAAGMSDPWLDAAEGAANVAGVNVPARRQEAIARLGPVVAAQPRLLRARMWLARAQADVGQTDAAVVMLDGVLAANPDHDGARRLKEQLLAPPPPKPVVVELPHAAPPPRKPGRLPRKNASTRAP